MYPRFAQAMLAAWLRFDDQNGAERRRRSLAQSANLSRDEMCESILGSFGETTHDWDLTDTLIVPAPALFPR